MLSTLIMFTSSVLSQKNIEEPVIIPSQNFYFFIHKVMGVGEELDDL